MSSNEPTEPGTPPMNDMDDVGHRLHELPDFTPPASVAQNEGAVGAPTPGTVGAEEVPGVQPQSSEAVNPGAPIGDASPGEGVVPLVESAAAVAVGEDQARPTDDSALDAALQDVVAEVIAEADAGESSRSERSTDLDETPPEVGEVEGVLVAHGRAPLNNEPGARESYFVSVRGPDGVTVLWGDDLERAVNEKSAAPGARVRLQFAGSAPVAVSTPELDAEGRVTGQARVKAIRNAWALTLLPSATAEHQARQPERSAPPSPASSADSRDEAFMTAVQDILRDAVGSPRAAPAIPAPAPAPVSLSSVPLAEGQVRTGISGAIQGAAATTAELARGAVGVAGAVGTAAVRAVSDIVREAQGRGRTVLPRLGDYRVEQLERHAQNYVDAQEHLWNATPRLLALRNEIAERARVTGASLPDVVEKMRPGGEYSDLGARFCAAVSESPDATSHKKAMDKALDAFTKQYEGAREEQLNPEVAQSEMQVRLAERVEKAREKMEGSAGTVPPFANPSGGVEPSHLERLREAIEKIVEKIKAIAEQVRDMFRGKRADADAETPSP